MKMIGLHKRAVLMIIPLFISLAGSYLYWLCDNENTETMILNTSIFGSLLSVPAILFYDWYTHRKLWKLPVWIISFAMFFLQGTSDRYAENIISIQNNISLNQVENNSLNHNKIQFENNKVIVGRGLFNS